MQKIRWFFLIVGIILALAMALQNNEPTAIKLLWLGGEFPLSVLLVVASAIGFLFGALITALMLRSRKPTPKPAPPAKSTPPAKPEAKEILGRRPE